jgi:hypothetical protein
MPELLVPAFFLIFLYKYAGTISSGVFFYFFYINMPELLVPAFFLINCILKNVFATFLL